VPVEVLLDADTLLATHHDGEPLAPEHGAPLRVVIPSCYAWKSVKWLRGIEFLGENRPGFWESYGYSDSADPWREDRFAS
jgi:DMSO/TMAO reductase YedYZ molybdopterin-dependent catalytic subunit